MQQSKPADPKRAIDILLDIADDKNNPPAMRHDALMRVVRALESVGAFDRVRPFHSVVN